MQQNDINHRLPRKWTVMKVEVAEAQAEIAASFMGSLSDSGVVDNTYYKPDSTTDLCSLSVFLEEDDLRDGKIELLKDFLEHLHRDNPQNFIPKLTSEVLIEEDWGSTWKKHFKPIHPTKRIVIKPSWEHYESKDGEFIIEIDPGMAFGTGMHASTQLSLQFIDELFRSQGHKPTSALDVGTGTGILGMGAALLGCPSIIGIDNDIDARVAATENIRKNHLEAQMTITENDLGDLSDLFELVIANIIHNTLIELAQQLRSRVAPGGHLILAGILSGKQAENIIRTFENLGLRLVEEKKQEEWSALCLKSN